MPAFQERTLLARVNRRNGSPQDWSSVISHSFIFVHHTRAPQVQTRYPLVPALLRDKEISVHRHQFSLTDRNHPQLFVVLKFVNNFIFESLNC